MRFVVSELFRNHWRAFALIPANDPDAAIATARRVGMRPKKRLMKAAIQKVTKR